MKRLLFSLMILSLCIDGGVRESEMPLYVFEGTWYEMGVQYGENCTHIREVYDFYLNAWLNDNLTMEQLREAIDVHASYTQDLDERIIQFMEGIGEGSAKYFEDVEFSPFDRIMLINIGFEIIWGMGWYGDELDEIDKVNGEIDKMSCTSIAALGSATKEQHTIVGINRDLPLYPFKYQIAYVLKPETGDTVFGTVTEGQVASNFQVNSAHLWVGATKIPGDYVPEHGIIENAFGVPSLPLILELSAFCDDVEECCELLTETKVTQGMNYIFATPDEVRVVEKLPDYYAFRSPENDIIVMTNNNMADYSYNERGERTDIPMYNRIYLENPWEIKAIESSYYSSYWELINNHGNITPETWMEKIGQMHYCYSKSGDKSYEFEGRSALEYGMTIEYQKWEDGELVEGTISSHCCDLNTLDIYFVQGLPSTHENWQRINLNRV